MYLAFGIIILSALIFMTGIIVYTLIKSLKEGEEIISKKNLIYIVPLYCIVYLLYVLASVYSREEMDFFHFFTLLYYTAESVIKFKLQTGLIMPLCDAVPIIKADLIIACILCFFAVTLGVLSLFSQRIRNFVSVRVRLYKGCDIVPGDSKSALRYIKNYKNCILLGTDITRQRYNELVKDGITVLRMPFAAQPLLKKLGRRKHNIIVFRDGNYSYTKIIETFTALRQGGSECGIYLEGNQEAMKILKEKFVSDADVKAGAHISCFSRHELMARRFVVDYPITRFIPRDFYNSDYTVKDGKEINVVFIGFGKVNYQLFRMCSMQFQFAGIKSGKLCAKPVNYYIYDNEKKALNNEFFTRLGFEFDEEFKDCDFPKPEKICNIADVKPWDINSEEAKKKFKSLVTKDSFTYFVISLDNDLEDASYARTVRRLLNSDDNFRIFVRARNDSGEKLNAERLCDGDTDEKIIYFGEEKKLYTHENIVNDELLELAQRINLLYNNVKNPPEWLKSIKQLKPEAQKRILNEYLEKSKNRQYMQEQWASLIAIEQDSNLYHALNLPFKLNLLGFGMVKKRDGEIGVSEEKFDERYINSGRANGYNDYSFFFKTESSNVLAFIEHSRWNALYIMYDYKQMKKKDLKIVKEKDEKGKEVLTVPHKNGEKKQHACLTTYYGLNELIIYKYRMLYPDADADAADFNTDPRLLSLGKIYAYDYMDLDRLYGEITAMGYILKDNEKQAGGEAIR